MQSATMYMPYFSKICLFGIFFGQVYCFATEDAVIDAGELGKIQGNVVFTTPSYSRYYGFFGIPYAKPPLGERRFKPPEPWSGSLGQEGELFYANRTFVACPQFRIGSTVNLNPLRSSLNNYKPHNDTSPIMGQEDCLILNINTPLIGSDRGLLPVIIFFHGGSFVGMWSNLFNGHRLLDSKEIVFVTVNYRLGALGFLNLGTDDAPGNAGLYDAVEALRWIKKNIKHFGGDPDNVLISGQSAGAALVTHLMISPIPQAENLFHKVIATSGSGLLEWATAPDPIPHSLKVAQFSGCYRSEDGTPDYASVIKCMKYKTPEELIIANSKYSRDERKNFRLGFWATAPSVQKNNSLTIPVIVPEMPAEAMKKKRQADVPLMMGATRHEGSLMVLMAYLEFLIPNNLHNNTSFLRNQLLATFLYSLGIEDDSDAVAHAMEETYMGEGKYTEDFESKIPGLIDFFSVLFFKANCYKTIQLHSQKNRDSYWYSFDYVGSWSLFGEASDGFIPAGVAHADDTLYLFRLLPHRKESDWAVSRRWIRQWINFAKTGNPNSDETVFWPRYSDEGGRSYLKINATESIESNYPESWKHAAFELIGNQNNQSTSTMTSKICNI